MNSLHTPGIAPSNEARIAGSSTRQKNETGIPGRHFAVRDSYVAAIRPGSAPRRLKGSVRVGRVRRYSVKG